MSNKLNIRTYTWLANGLSWAYVIERLINAFDDMNHNTYVVSTNGINEKSFSENKMINSVLGLQKFGPGKKAIDIDLCYTVPQNFPKRFLSNSKHKCAIYNYEGILNGESFTTWLTIIFRVQNFLQKSFI